MWNLSRNHTLMSKFCNRVKPGHLLSSRSPALLGIHYPRKLDSGGGAIQWKSTAMMVAAPYDQSIPDQTFPSIVIGPNKTILPQGSFAEAQAQVRHNKMKRIDCI
jgi:hypothetical protein